VHNADPGALSCPLPIHDLERITLAHGGGGTVMHRLLNDVFLRAFDNPHLQQRHDAAVVDLGGPRVAFTTDSFVVQPLFFPGGDIGTLAVCGTVNDLAMAGARPLFLSAGFILEAGLAVETLKRTVESMRRAAQAASVEIVTGDTKVVDKGKGDGLFINTAGVGVIEHGFSIGPNALKAGDAVIVNGDLGRHGIAVMAVREGLEFETPIESDVAPLAAPVLDLILGGIDVHCLRDCTRGGLTSALNEICMASALAIHIEESAVPVREEVRGACELLGLDPLSVASEGRFVAFVSSNDADHAIDILRRHAPDTAPARIGGVVARKPPRVTMTSVIGAERVLDMLSGEQLPRIC
jgi:hydrogenase expression/formation protein HypE